MIDYYVSLFNILIAAVLDKRYGDTLFHLALTFSKYSTVIVRQYVS